MHRFTLVDQFTLENCLLWFNRSVQYSSPVVQSSEWIHPTHYNTRTQAHHKSVPTPSSQEALALAVLELHYGEMTGAEQGIQ